MFHVPKSVVESEVSERLYNTCVHKLDQTHDQTRQPKSLRHFKVCDSRSDGFDKGAQHLAVTLSVGNRCVWDPLQYFCFQSIQPLAKSASLQLHHTAVDAWAVGRRSANLQLIYGGVVTDFNDQSSWRSHSIETCVVSGWLGSFWVEPGFG